ncbi:hypothetical protein YTPLAS18_16220 [Nitrospira sp.]|nr:hypothetical protein YTPLAS18_16220 [Nitrospira sp.]
MKPNTQHMNETLRILSRPTQALRLPKLISHPMLDALRDAGAVHVYADSANVQELADLLYADRGSLFSGVDGNTINQPLAHKVIAEYLSRMDQGMCADEFGSGNRSGELRDPARCYAVLCSKMANDFEHLFASGRRWETSLQLHMSLSRDVAQAQDVARLMRDLSPGAIVKVPLTPYEPRCFVLARNLEREGIPVNFTSTFSARQAIAAALLCRVARTNIFMGRLDQGLQSARLGAHVCLETQRALRQLRRELDVPTLLIIASLRNAQHLYDTAGCDVYTIPVKVLREWLTEAPWSAEQIGSQLDTSYADRLGIGATVPEPVRSRIDDLYRIDPEFMEFLLSYAASVEWQEENDGDTLAKRFEEAGFGQCFYAPDRAEWAEIKSGKLPDLSGSLAHRLPLDTLFSLHADGDFENHQAAMDTLLAEHVRG